MPKKRKWTDEQLAKAVKNAYSTRMVIQALGLIPAGGNYDQVNKRISLLKLDSSHFTGKGWHTGERVRAMVSATPLTELLINGSSVQSYKLKKKLFEEGVKKPECEICRWSVKASDGRIPVELDHINGNRTDNRLVNLRILCPNCHSLQPTHRGKNKFRGR